MNIGKKLRALRNSNKLTMTVAAKKAGISQSYLSEIERGVKVPPLNTLEELCNIYDTNLAEFFANELFHATETVYDKLTLKESAFAQYLALPDDIKPLIRQAQELRPSQLALIKNLIKEFSLINKFEDHELEILDILENKEKTITASGKPLSLKDKIKLLEFLKNELNAVPPKDNSERNMVLAASYKGDRMDSALPNRDDIMKAIEFADEQERKKKSEK